MSRLSCNLKSDFYRPSFFSCGPWVMLNSCLTNVSSILLNICINDCISSRLKMVVVSSRLWGGGNIPVLFIVCSLCILSIESVQGSSWFNFLFEPSLIYLHCLLPIQQWDNGYSQAGQPRGRRRAICRIIRGERIEPSSPYVEFQWSNSESWL